METELAKASLNILVVDDEVNIRKTLAISLEADGHHVIAVSNPEDARSECAFSGLQDGDGAGFPAPGTAAPQNFGHTLQDAANGAFGPDITNVHDIKAAGFAPGDACNGHKSPSK